MSDYHSLIIFHQSLKDLLKKTEEELFTNHLISWRSKADAGFVVAAIMQFRKENPDFTISESKDAVNSYLENTTNVNS